MLEIETESFYELHHVATIWCFYKELALTTVTQTNMFVCVTVVTQLHRQTCLFVCVTEVSVTQKFCNSPHYHLTSIKGQQYLHIREHQETQKLSGHMWLYVCTEALFCQSPRVSFYKGQPIPVFVLASGEMWLMLLSLSVKTWVWGRISKKCAFLWNQENWGQQAGLLKLSQ